MTKIKARIVNNENQILISSSDSCTTYLNVSKINIPSFSESLQILNKLKKVCKEKSVKANGIMKAEKKLKALFDDVFFEKTLNNFDCAFLEIKSKFNELAEKIQLEKIDLDEHHHNFTIDSKPLKDDQKEYMHLIGLIHQYERLYLDNKPLREYKNYVNELQQFVSTVENVKKENELKIFI